MIHVPAHRPDDIHPLDDLAEDDMPAVQPGGLLDGDEELRAVSVLPGVSHRQPTRAVVLQLEVLIGEPGNSGIHDLSWVEDDGVESNDVLDYCDLDDSSLLAIN